MAEERKRISTSRPSSGDVSRRSFTLVRRGYDPDEVRSYLDQLGQELDQLVGREDELRSALASAKATVATSPQLDESSLSAQLGQKSAEVLRAAHDEARSLLEAARSEAGALLASAQARAVELVVEAEQKAAARVGDAEVAASGYEAEALEAAKRAVAKGRADGETLVVRAQEQGRSMIDQAQDVRNRVLADMNTRRRAVHVQIEQLRAARDRLAEAIVDVRSSIDHLAEDLDKSDDEARAAAEEVARRQPSLADLDLPAVDAVFDVEMDASEVSEQGASEQQFPGPTTSPGGAPEGASARELEEFDELVPAPESGVVEELFAKIRASAHDEEAPSEGLQPDQTAPASPESHVISARDAALSGARSSLARKVKRTLQDEQNRLLDAVRAGRSVDDSMLEDEQAQLAALAAASVDPLRDAAAAGRSFAVDRGAHPRSKLADGAVMAIAESLASQIATPLRRRLSEALGTADPAGEVSAAFREWRGSRLDRALGDAALEAFSAATVDAVGAGQLRWVPAGTPSPCPDCADNGLEAVTAGSSFPTGQTHPPAHAGCRCAVLPVLD